MSRDVVELTGSRVQAEFLPATLVDVQVNAPATILTKDLVVLCESELGRESARLHDELLAHRRGGQILRRARFLLPHGRTHLVLWHRRLRQTLAHHDLLARDGLAVVRLRIRRN